MNLNCFVYCFKKKVPLYFEDGVIISVTRVVRASFLEVKHFSSIVCSHLVSPSVSSFNTLQR